MTVNPKKLFDFYGYIALNNPNEANQLLQANGYEIPADTVDRRNALIHFVGNDEQRLSEVTDIHPDKELLNEQYKLNFCATCAAAMLAANGDKKDDLKLNEQKPSVATTSEPKEKFTINIRDVALISISTLIVISLAKYLFTSQK